MKHIATNPYLPGWEYVPDGEPRVFDGRVYVYGSHDAPDGSAYCPGDYVCWSAPEDDLSAWTFEGVIWRKEDDPNNAALSGYGAPDGFEVARVAVAPGERWMWASAQLSGVAAGARALYLAIGGEGALDLAAFAVR